MAYLDKDGVRKLWSKIIALFNKGVTDISINGKTVTITKGDGSTSTQTTKDTEYGKKGRYELWTICCKTRMLDQHTIGKQALSAKML